LHIQELITVVSRLVNMMPRYAILLAVLFYGILFLVNECTRKRKWELINAIRSRYRNELSQGLRISITSFVDAQTDSTEAVWAKIPLFNTIITLVQNYIWTERLMAEAREVVSCFSPWYVRGYLVTGALFVVLLVTLTVHNMVLFISWLNKSLKSCNKATYCCKSGQISSVNRDDVHEDLSADSDDEYEDPLADSDSVHEDPSTDCDDVHEDPSADSDDEYEDPSADADDLLGDPSVEVVDYNEDLSDNFVVTFQEDIVDLKHLLNSFEEDLDKFVFLCITHNLTGTSFSEVTNYTRSYLDFVKDTKLFIDECIKFVENPP
ncbi:hypothetical protein OTU49_014704, partial [Cherax quadricarinatus]